jgi:hypothetical protein
MVPPQDILYGSPLGRDYIDIYILWMTVSANAADFARIPEDIRALMERPDVPAIPKIYPVRSSLRLSPVFRPEFCFFSCSASITFGKGAMIAPRR